MSFTVKDFEGEKYLSKFKTKLQENNILNFIDHQDAWGDISKFVIILNYPVEYTKEISKYIDELSFQHVYMISSQKLQENIDQLPQLFSH
jgi:hypothetical protein